MKLATSQAETSGNLVFKRKIPMRISEAGRAIIIKSIIDMYSNPYVAVLREYTSNAYDSHVWAGQTRPVEVTLPSRLAPNFIVQDWGIGLSADELEDYTQFGESTKRDTNDQIGGFGLGSKSGLAVCSRFTVETVKDGKRSVAVIGRDADGPQMGLLVEDEDTDLPNGLKVTIPTTEAYKFQEALDKNFFLGYPAGSILINGAAPALSVHDQDTFSALEEFGWLNVKPGTWQGNDHYTGTALLGPVRYKIDWNEARINEPQARGGILKEVIVKLDNGEVDLTPSREALIYSTRTRAHIASRVAEVLSLAKVRYAEQIEKAENLRDAIKLVLKAQEYGIKGDFTWGGKKIEMTKVSDDLINSTLTVCEIGYGRGDGVATSRDSWNGANVLNNFHFLGSKVFKAGRTVLITECEPPVKTSRWLTQHALAKGNSHFARALAVRDDKDVHGYMTVYTSFAASEFPEAFLAAFDEVVTSEDAKGIVSDFRKANRIAASAAAPKAPKRDQDIVNVLTHFREGYSRTEDVKIADMDATKKYILLRNMSGGVEEKVRRAMLLKVGQAEYGTSLNAMIAAVSRDGGYGFIFANKTWNTDDYSKYLSFVTFEEAAQAVYKKAVVGLTPIQRLAGEAQRGYGHSWAGSLRPNHVKQIKRDDLRVFLEALGDKSIAPKLGMIENMYRATHAGVSLDKAFTDSLPSNPCADYPLLAHVGYTRDAHDDIVEYINMLDAAKGRISVSADA